MLFRSALSGLHAPYVMVTLDESGDIPVPILRSGEQILSSKFKWAKVLQGGNPTSLEGALYHAAVVAAGVSPADVTAISADGTSSTLVALDPLRCETQQVAEALGDVGALEERPRALVELRCRALLNGREDRKSTRLNSSH